MLEPWNNSKILPPPIHTCPPESRIDVKQISYTCKSITKVLSKQSPLHQEGAILSRIIYKFDKKFRNDLGYRNLRKVNTALRRYLTLNFAKDVKSFASVLPKDEDENYLPTRQMLEYVLVRQITFAKLMIRIGTCSKQAAIFYLDRLKRGESYWMSLMPYALLSRLWSISVVLIKHSCIWYSQLYPFLDELQLKGLPFLPKDFSLPVDLEDWLDVKNMDNFSRFEWSQKKQINIEALVLEDLDGDISENIMKYVDLVNQKESPEKELQIENELKRFEGADRVQVQDYRTAEKPTDQGQIVSREAFKNLFKDVTVPAKVDHYAERVTNKESLRQFINTEEKFRNEENDQSLTAHLSFMQWQALKNSLASLLESLTNNRKIERKFKIIWKEKCMDYK